MPEPDATLRRFLGYDMKRAFAVIQTDVNAVLAPFGLRMVTFSVLVVIRDNPRLKQTQLADILSIERPNLVLMLDELEKAKAVVRVRAPDDRRAHEISVTLQGRQLCDRALQAVAEHDARMGAGLSDDDRDALHKAMRIIQSNGGTVDVRGKISRS